MPKPILTLPLLLLTALTGCATTPPPPEPTPITIYERDRFRISAQPSEADLRAAADANVAMVISLRSEREMDELDFDQAALVQSLGMTYTHIPMGSDHGYDPAQIAAFADALASTNGTIHIHCASGTRARNLWMAHAITTNQLTVNQAKQAEQDLGGKPSILEQLLGQTLTYDLAPKAKP